jgi:hypothetical protein
MSHKDPNTKTWVNRERGKQQKNTQKSKQINIKTAATSQAVAGWEPSREVRGPRTASSNGKRRNHLGVGVESGGGCWQTTFFAFYLKSQVNFFFLKAFVSRVLFLIA